MVWTRDVTSWGGNWVTISIPFFLVKKIIVSVLYMDCEDLKKKVLECNENMSENRECKEIIEKFQFECEKGEEEKEEEKKGWFGFANKSEEVKVEEEEKEKEERKKDEDKFDST